MYSNSCCSCSFEREIIKIGQSSHKMYSNNIVNFQDSTTILNTHTKKSGNLSYAPRIYIYIYIYIYINSSAQAGCDTRSLFKRSVTECNFLSGVFRVHLLLDWLPNKGWRISLSYYLPIVRRGIIGFIPFLRVLVRYEMQSASSKVWTCVVVSITYDDNYYVTDTFIHMPHI